MILLFQPDNKKCEIEREENLLFGAEKAGVLIDGSCGGAGICGKCKIRVISGTVSPLTEKEKEILTAQAMNEGKPANIAEKMVMGRINKFYKEVCLLDQEFIKDNDLTVAKYVANVAKELGGKIEVKAFARFEKGEGLEKRNDNFADEVANMIK